MRFPATVTKFLIRKIPLGLALLLLILSNTQALVAAPTVQTTPETADYLSPSLRLLFPSLPANIELDDITKPDFPSNALESDYLSLGALTDPDSANGGTQPITKTISFNFKGGVRGRIFSQPAWLVVRPNYFANRNGQGQLNSVVGVREDAANGAGLLPSQHNWGGMHIELNGFVFDYAATVLVGPPKNESNVTGDKVFGLYREILSQLDKRGDLVAGIGTVNHPNGSQFALGLVVDYLGEGEYNGRMSATDFAGRVAETLAEKDYNGDGWVGFTSADILVGAPGWVLGRSVAGDVSK